MELIATILSGVCVFFLSQVCLEIFIKPIQEYKQLKRDISVCITKNANYYTSILMYDKCPEEEKQKRLQISEETRFLASELRGFIEALPLFYVGIPRRKIIFDTSAELIGLSNGLFHDSLETNYGFAEGNATHIRQIKKLLKLYDI